MKIKYTFVTGETVEIEVDAELGNVVIAIEHDQSNRDRAETRRHSSLDQLAAAGFDPADKAAGPAAVFEQKEAIAAHLTNLAKLRKVMSELLPQQQDLIRKIYFENRTMTSIANEEAVSVAAIHDRLKKIHQKLKKLLS
ncbi:MAG TPA: sigma-70 family RNA polymerase sigma factor [Clostridiales bacterium]|nr:sigma-70 family RNA polymerase sigma factor [Clostridiales bacterium]